jgi:hypothetical protein
MSLRARFDDESALNLDGPRTKVGPEVCAVGVLEGESAGPRADDHGTWSIETVGEALTLKWSTLEELQVVDDDLP